MGTTRGEEGQGGLASPTYEQLLEENRALKTAFESLTPGRQRAYLLYFAAPKQSKTRDSRIEKCLDMIFDGMGLNEQ